MEYKGEARLKKVGGSYAFFLPIWWIKANNINKIAETDNNIYFSLFDRSITLRPIISSTAGESTDKLNTEQIKALQKQESTQ